MSCPPSWRGRTARRGRLLRWMWVSSLYASNSSSLHASCSSCSGQVLLLADLVEALGKPVTRPSTEDVFIATCRSRDGFAIDSIEQIKPCNPTSSIHMFLGIRNSTSVAFAVFEPRAHETCSPILSTYATSNAVKPRTNSHIINTCSQVRRWSKHLSHTFDTYSCLLQFCSRAIYSKVTRGHPENSEISNSSLSHN